MPVPVSVAELVAELSRPGPRRLIGLAGAPGAGKSTIAAELIAALSERGVAAVTVPMDGFHLADVTLRRLGRRDRKGAPDTFDAEGYVALLRRLRAGDHTVYAPAFERGLEQPLAAAITVDSDVAVVITEGNYLLMDAEPWRQIPGLLDEVIYVRLDDEQRREWLVARHVQFGKTPEQAQAWVATVDEPNAALIAATAVRAQRVLER